MTPARRSVLLGSIHGLRIAIDVEESANLALVSRAARALRAGDVILDAGAGRCPYRGYFHHVRYESCDRIDSGNVHHTYCCDVAELPVESDRYDAIVCVQVLDDVPRPQQVLNEFARVLKPGGYLFLSVPMATRLHAEPHHYFQFTPYGLNLLCEGAGLVVDWIEPRGGLFAHWSYLASKTPRYMARQCRANLPDNCGAARYIVGSAWNAMLRAARLTLMPFFEVLAPLVLLPLDRLDRERAFTLGYNACARKGVGRAIGPDAAGGDAP